GCCVYVHEHAIGGLSLAAVARDGVAVVKVRIGVHAERHASPRLQSHPHLPADIEMLHGAEFPIRDVPFTEGCGELHAVADRHRTLAFSKDGDALETTGVIG